MDNTTIFWGLRDDMVAEVSAWDPRQIDCPARACRYLVKIVGAAEYDTEWFPSRKEALAAAKEQARHLGVPIRGVS